jgi:DNA-binding NtrC family response regulator
VDTTTTKDDTSSALRDGSSGPTPGIVVVVRDGQPVCEPRATGSDPVTFGRGAGAVDVVLDGEKMSRRHARAQFMVDGWIAEDLGSRNGTRANGVRLEGPAVVRGDAVLVIGSSIVLLERDIGRFARGRVEVTDRVEGPVMRQRLSELAAAAAQRAAVLIVGETGVGKERAARLFHRSSPNARGQFVAVNCARIDPGLADRVLFGTKKGVYSGATHDALGFFEEAHGGVLFLDELQELEERVQAKILRTIQERTVQRLGSSVETKVNVLVVCATNADLDERVATGKFRRDLYERLRHFRVELPPLRDRVEEIPYLIRFALAARHSDLSPRADFMEECLLRAWMANVRELLDVAMTTAVIRADARGDGKLIAEDLPAVPACDPLRAPSRVAPEPIAVGRSVHSGPTALVPPTPQGSPGALDDFVRSTPGAEKLSYDNLQQLLRFRDALAACGSVREAAERVGIKQSTAYEWRDLLEGKGRSKRR